MSNVSYVEPTEETFIHWGEYCYRRNWNGPGIERPSLGGNMTFLIIFAILLQPQIFLAVKHRTVGTGIFFVAGVTAEILAFVSRVMASLDPFYYEFIIIGYSLPIIGPTLIAAGVFHALSRIIVVFDGDDVETKAARWKPRTYTFISLGCTFVTLALQSIGLGLFTSMRATSDQFISGFHIYFAGVVVHLASLLLFIVLYAELAFKWRNKARQGTLNKKHASIYQSKRFKFSIYALLIATVCLFSRALYQVVRETLVLTGNSPIHGTEPAFLSLNGAMVAIACIALTLLHPGFGFGALWKEGGLRSGRKSSEVESAAGGSESTSFESVRKEEGNENAVKAS